MLGIISAGIGMVTGAFSAVAGFVTGALGGIFVGNLGRIIVNQVIIKLLSKLFSTENDDEIKEMGDRVIQGEEQGIKMEDYESFEEYQAALRGIKLNSERSNSLKPEEKEIAGVAFYLKELESRYDFGIDAIAKLVEKNEKLIENDKLGVLIEKLKENDFSETDILNYYEGKMENETIEKIEKILDLVINL